MPVTCNRCGAALAESEVNDRFQGVCPKCLAEAALETSVAPQQGPPPLAPGQTFQGMEIVEVLGRGGMGVVYKARQPHLDRFVALKVLPRALADDPQFVERFRREAKALAALSHANIVGVHDFGIADGTSYLVMEHIDGTNLRAALQAKRLTPEEAMAIVPQLCDALQYAHDEGIVHRDIKPENILLDRKGRVKIADFGLAKIVGGEVTRMERITRTGYVLGTPSYMAPEQLEDPQKVDHRADIYSMGVVFYEMLTGELPLGAFAPPSKKVEVDVRLDEVVLKTLAKEPERRYQHASEVKEDVTRATPTAAEKASQQAKRAKELAAIAKAEAAGALAELNRWKLKSVLLGLVQVIAAAALCWLSDRYDAKAPTAAKVLGTASFLSFFTGLWNLGFQFHFLLSSLRPGTHLNAATALVIFPGLLADMLVDPSNAASRWRWAFIAGFFVTSALLSFAVFRRVQEVMREHRRKDLVVRVTGTVEAVLELAGFFLLFQWKRIVPEEELQFSLGYALAAYSPAVIAWYWKRMDVPAAWTVPANSPLRMNSLRSLGFWALVLLGAAAWIAFQVALAHWTGHW